MSADREKFNNAIGTVKIPILILDNKWHRIFGKMNPTGTYEIVYQGTFTY